MNLDSGKAAVPPSDDLQYVGPPLTTILESITVRRFTTKPKGFVSYHQLPFGVHYAKVKSVLLFSAARDSRIPPFRRLSASDFFISSWAGSSVGRATYETNHVCGSNSDYTRLLTRVSVVQLHPGPSSFPKISQKQKRIMAKTKESREWYKSTMRAIATKNWPIYSRCEYLYETLLNFIESYKTYEIGKDRDWLLGWTEWIRKNCMYCVANSIDTERFAQLYWKIMLIEARHRKIDSYFLYLERKREQKNKFYEPRREQLIKHGIIQAVQDLVDDKLDILTISCPPGVGKSTVEIFLLSGIIGWFPEMPNLASSFSGTMTKSLFDGVNQILADPVEYGWHDIFPNATYTARESTNSKDQTINIGRPKRFKSLTCRAIGASLTGNTRCEYLLCCDDLVSGIEEALNKERLDKLWQTYNTDLVTRRKDRCKELHICTRWSVHDPVGRLIDLNSNNPRARFIAIPALDETGESNFDYDGGVGFSKEYFLNIKRSMDEISYKCLFDNQPVEREGLLYHNDEIRRYLDLPITPPDAILSVVDTKNKGTDYFVQPVFLKYGEDYYCIDAICDDNSDYEVQYSRSTNILLTNKVEACLFESNNGGDRVALEVSKRVKSAGGYCNITQQFTSQNKETKIIVYAPWVKEHVIFKDVSMYAPNDDYGRMMGFLLGYTIAGKAKHDDVPDAFSSFAKWKSRPETPPTITGRRPF